MASDVSSKGVVKILPGLPAISGAIQAYQGAHMACSMTTKSMSNHINGGFDAVRICVGRLVRICV